MLHEISNFILQSYAVQSNLFYLLLVLLSPFIAIFLEGLRRKLIARIHNRVGPPLFQPLYDILKLFGKKTHKEKNFLFNIAPFLLIIIAFLIMFFVPYSFFVFDFDFIVLIYLFILFDSILIAAVISTESPFAIHGAMREVVLMLGYEIGFLVMVSIFIAKEGVVSLAQFSSSFMFLQLPIASLLLIYVGYVILKNTPFDVVSADPEIGEGMLTEYYGLRLGLIELAEYMKNYAFYLIMAILIFGRPWLLGGVLFFVLFYAFNQAASPRYIPFRATKLMMFAVVLGFIDLFILI